jgi:hypothetical protein
MTEIEQVLLIGIPVILALIYLYRVVTKVQCTYVRREI